MTAVTSQPVNAEGKASFTVNSVSGPKWVSLYNTGEKGSMLFYHHNAIIVPNQGLFHQTSMYPIVNMSQPWLVGVLFPCCSTRGYYQLEFRGFFNKKPIPGPSVNLSVIPDPNKPVSLSVQYDIKAKFPAGGRFPGVYLYFFFSVREVFLSLHAIVLLSFLTN